MKTFRNIIAAVLTAAFFMSATLTVEAATASTEVSFETIMLDKINSLRDEVGEDALLMDAELTSIAEIRAQEVSEKWSHTRPDGTEGIDMIDITKWAGENLSYCSDCENAADIMFDALCDSPTHYDNMVFGEFTSIGIATYEANGRIYVAYMFSS